MKADAYQGESLAGKRVVMVDDSYRARHPPPGRSSSVLLDAGAAEVHVRITAPPVRFPCFYGIDMANQDDLVAAHHTVAEIRDMIGATSLGYLSLAGAVRAIGQAKRACSAAPALTASTLFPSRSAWAGQSLHWKCGGRAVGRGGGHPPRRCVHTGLKPRAQFAKPACAGWDTCSLTRAGGFRNGSTAIHCRVYASLAHRVYFCSCAFPNFNFRASRRSPSAPRLRLHPA